MVVNTLDSHSHTANYRLSRRPGGLKFTLGMCRVVCVFQSLRKLERRPQRGHTFPLFLTVPVFGEGTHSMAKKLKNPNQTKPPCFALSLMLCVIFHRKCKEMKSQPRDEQCGTFHPNHKLTRGFQDLLLHCTP